MRNLYTTKASAAGVAAHFRAMIPTNFNVAEGEVYPGGHGLVRDEDGQRVLQSMTWGFPLAMKSKKTGQPIKPKPSTLSPT